MMAMSERQRQRALALRAAMDVTGAAVDDQTASQAAAQYRRLQGNGLLIKAGARIHWDGGLLRAASDLWDRPEHWPDAAPNLWEAIAYHEGVRIIPETITQGLAFALGEMGYWPTDGKIYKSVLDANVWTPGAYPAGWEVAA